MGKKIFDSETDIEIVKDLEGDVMAIRVDGEEYEVEQTSTEYNEADDTLVTALTITGEGGDTDEDEEVEDFNVEVEEETEDEGDDEIGDSRKKRAARKADSRKAAVKASLRKLYKVVKDSASKLRAGKTVSIKLDSTLGRAVKDSQDRAILTRTVGGWLTGSKAISDSRKRPSVTISAKDRMCKIALR